MLSEDHRQQMSDWILAQVLSEDHGQQMSDHLPHCPAVKPRGFVAGGSPAPSLCVLEPDPDPNPSPAAVSLPTNLRACPSLSVPHVASAQRGAPPRSPSRHSSLPAAAGRSMVAPR